MLKMNVAAQAALVAGLAIGFGASQSLAQVSLYDSGGFESRFTPGAVLEGQDVTMGPWLKTSNPNPASAQVQAGVGVGGSQGVTMTVAGGTTGTQWLVDKTNLPVAPLNKIQVSWDMSVVDTNVSGLAFGPFFGVEIYDASGPTIRQVGGFGVDASTGELLKLVNSNGTAFYDILPSGASVALGQFNSFSITADYATKTYAMAVNGVNVDTQAFFDTGVTAFTDAPLSTQFVSNPGEQSLSAGVAYSDNYGIAMVPEPAMLSLAGLAAIGLLKRRR